MMLSFLIYSLVIMVNHLFPLFAFVVTNTSFVGVGSGDLRFIGSQSRRFLHIFVQDIYIT